MGKRCSVAGCKSNYDSSDDGYITVFSLPKNESLRSKWLQKIPTDFKRLKDPTVCIKHFEKQAIIWQDEIMVKGELKIFPRKVPKYKQDAIPSIFPNLAEKLSSSTKKTRRLIDVEQDNFNRAVKGNIEECNKYKKLNRIFNWNDIITYMKKRESVSKSWVILKKNSVLALCLIKTDVECPVVSGCITIAEKLEFIVYLDNTKIDTNRLPIKAKRLSSISSLEKILNFIENVFVPEESIMDMVIRLLKSHEDYDESKSLQFLTEQLILSGKHKSARIYSNQTIIFASCLYVQSSSTYNILHQAELLYLPHPKSLQKLVNKFSLNSSSLEGSINYLNTKKDFLKSHEFLVNLHIDEIYIHPEMSFKGGSLYGCSETNPSKIAKTAQIFRISSLLSKYRDVVSIVPVNNLTSDNLKNMCMTVIQEIEKLGFIIIAIISDNNNVNRKAFELFSPSKILQPCVPHPNDPNRSLFFIFDTIHTLKCIRNNWLSKKDDDRIIHLPDFESGEEIFTAHFKHLELMYAIEKNSFVKYGHLLTLQSLYPSSYQKQNVGLCLKVFSERNIVALKHIEKDNPSIFHNTEGTLLFLDIIVKFWKICNVKSVMEGTRFNDEYREAVKQNSVLQLQFLEQMSLWLKIWRKSVPIPQALTAETFQSIITTIDAFLLLIPYLFKHYSLDYILLSKFQNDNLEGRFGVCRQMSGANYYISFVQLLESERKIRFKNNILLSTLNFNIPLRTLLPFDEECDSTISIEQFSEILGKNFSLDQVPETNLSIITYIGGYAAGKVLQKRKCNSCIKWLQLDKEVTVESSYDFLKDLDRGKLTLPTEHAVSAVAVVWFSMNEIINKYKDIFLVCGDQLSVLFKLSSCMLFDRTSIPNLRCSCNENFYKKLEHICLISSRIFISNFIKSINDINTSHSTNANKRKIQKLM